MEGLPAYIFRVERPRSLLKGFDELKLLCVTGLRGIELLACILGETSDLFSCGAAY